MTSKSFSNFYERPSYWLLVLLMGASFTSSASNQLRDTTLLPIKDTLNSIFDELYGSEIKEVRLKTDLASLLANRNSAESVDGKFYYINRDSQKVKLGIKLQVRGKTRRRICDFPPLRIKFKKKALAKKNLLSFNRLKLVTHCLDSEKGTQNILKEYLAYKMYRVVTDLSFRVQLLKITYEDKKDSTRSFEQYGFLIEGVEEWANNQDCEVVDNLYNCPLADFDPEEYACFSLFQYMIGNTDWYIEMNHNIKLMAKIGVEQKVVVPYDFDSSGLVNAPYAKPNRDLRQKNVRQRIFMGKCDNEEALRQILDHFNKHRTELLDLADSLTLLNGKERKKCKKYLRAFFKTIEKPESLEKIFLNRS